MKNIGVLPSIGMILMAILSFANFSGIEIAGLAVIIGIIFFFIIKRREKQSSHESGLDLRNVRQNLKYKGIWLWIILPVVVNLVSIGIALVFLPDYLVHVVARTEAFLSWDLLLLLVFQLAFFALGEEIAWRAFFQNQLGEAMPILPALLLSSLLFALGHAVLGDASIVVYDLFFVFINSLLFGIVFYKTGNAWISAISHFLANFSSVVFFLWVY
ncbi:CPBP family intramembrane glutamic endopeptidase [Planococcus citreus]|uniref:CPBP family intramembrane glutamic endopeptidase n=1 Tax=Planococcus citreus TaxID=1373 RepID=UPI0010820B23|nr:CPBP family intramembrane glutamic endopeptidase [Planococcus citreus]